MGPLELAWTLIKQDDRGPNETAQEYNYRLFNENRLRNQPDWQYGESLEDFQAREDRYNQQVCYCGSGKVKQPNAYGPDMCSDCFKEISTNTLESWFGDENELPTVEAETGMTPRSAAVGPYGIDTFGQKLASEPFDLAWTMLKSYTSSPATPDGKIVPSFQGQQPQPTLAVAMREPQEGDSDFDNYDEYVRENWSRISDNEKKKLYDRTLPGGQFEFVNNPNYKEAYGKEEMLHPSNFSTVQQFEDTLSNYPTVAEGRQKLADTGLILDDSYFTTNA